MSEYKNRLNTLSRICERIKREDKKDMTKQDYLHRIIITRFIIRELVKEINIKSDIIRKYHREQRKLKEQNITFIPIEIALKKEKEKLNYFSTGLAELGAQLDFQLEMWQEKGATLKELFQLCGASSRVKQQDKKFIEESKDLSFSQLIFIYNLDYPQNKDQMLEMDRDAPFTHALKEFALWRMTHTKSGKEAAQEAFSMAFPNFFEQFDCMENENGEQIYYIPPEE